MRPSIHSIVRQALLASAAAPLLLGGCGGGTTTKQITVASTAPDGGPVSSAAVAMDCGLLCGIGPCSDFLGCSDDGATTDGGILVTCSYGQRGPFAGQCTGRRPAGLQTSSAGGPAVGRYFARAAHLEAASVVAFTQLSHELCAHQAPSSLVLRALRARTDEIRHARLMGRLARRHGSPVPRVEAQATPIRPLAEVAAENAVEGCVRETFGALIGHWQLRAATELAIEAALSEIARDEVAHAQLAWDVAAWAETRLDPASRAHLVEAQTSAVRELRRDLQTAPAEELVDANLMPSAHQARALFDEMNRHLWRRSAFLGPGRVLATLPPGARDAKR